MADRPAGRPAGRLGSRLALAFVAVAVSAVALLAALTLLATGSEVSRLAAAQHQDAARSAAVALGQAYRGAGGWTGADLRPAYTLAAAAGAQLQVLDRRGRPVAPGPAQDMTGMMGAMHAPGGTSAALGAPVRAAVLVAGVPAGTAVLRFPGSGLTAADQRVRSALEQTVIAGAALAALLALVVAWLVSRRITRPLVQLTSAVRSMGSGTRGARARQPSAPGELGELSAAFDTMADALDHADTLRRQVLSDVAHELRTPITIMQAYCEQLADGTEPATPARLASLRDEVLRLGRLVADLETLAAAEAASLHIVKAPADLAAVAADAADLLGPAFAAAGTLLEAHLQPAALNADATRLSQIVTNLLSNALKFSPADGHVTLTVAASNGLARLEVSDDGPGIPGEELPHVFERFWRGSAGRLASGSGIGLAVVAELARAHGGRAEVTSEPGHGARFTILLPRP
jgi:two-component system, OmpR family, sensor histidine kinase BaeS